MLKEKAMPHRGPDRKPQVDIERDPGGYEQPTGKE